MIVFSKEDREVAQGIYGDMADAVAAAIVRREATVGAVHVVAHQHRFGVDLASFSTRDRAERRLVDIMSRECARDPDLRERVCARFGAWPAAPMPDEAIERLTAEWSSLTDGDSLWITECDVDATSRSATHAHPPPHPPPHSTPEWEP